MGRYQLGKDIGHKKFFEGEEVFYILMEAWVTKGINLSKLSNCMWLPEGRWW